MGTRIGLGMVAASLLLSAPGTGAVAADRVKIAAGEVEGALADASGVRSFKGIPFAAPPVGELRFRAPQPAKPWQGVRQATAFGPRCMQKPIFDDMVFRSDGVSEDCLYLNVWTPARSATEKLPVLVYFFGGGFVAGDGSEPRYDGQSMAKKGIVTVTTNYRLGVFGFLAHPELSAESPHAASGNQGLLDQSAALRWVRENIAAFGGDPARITIAGESAGSASVSAQMASPLSRDLIAGAIGESGAMLARTLAPSSLAERENAGAEFAASIGSPSLAALRSLSAQALLDAATKGNPYRFSATIDGHFLPKPVEAIFSAGEQAKVPLLAGWNSEEMHWRGLLGPAELTPEAFAQAVKRHYGNDASQVLAAYSASTPEELLLSATDLASDRFIAFSTWKWLELHALTGKPTYRYLYARPRPAAKPVPGATKPPQPPARGAVHSAEIEYALGNLDTNPAYEWKAEDYQVSRLMQEYFAAFVKTGDPNTPGLPAWPAMNSGEKVKLMHIDTETRVEEEPHRNRYLLLDRLSGN